MIFGAMLINDFLVFRKLLKGEYIEHMLQQAADHGLVIISEKKEKEKVADRGRKNRKKTIVATSVAVFLFLVCPIVVLSLVSYTATVNLTPVAGQILYAHEEQTLIGPPFIVCYLLKLDSADSAGTTRSAVADSTGRKFLGFWVYQLTGVQSISASLWTIYYRVYKTHSAVEAHCDVNIRIRMSNGTLRHSIATDVANSGALTTSWSTLSGTYSWADYTVVDETDYLEIDFYIEVTSKRNNEDVNLRVDDNTLAVANQTRVANIYLSS